MTKANDMPWCLLAKLAWVKELFKIKLMKIAGSVAKIYHGKKSCIGLKLQKCLTSEFPKTKLARQACSVYIYI